MTINENATEFAGLPVRDYDPNTGIDDPMGTAPRLRLEYNSDRDATLVALLDRFLADPAAVQVRALVIGIWTNEYHIDLSSAPVVARLVAARDQLPNLKALFLGDITYEELEITWIKQCDLTPLLESFPKLEHLKVRGSGAEYREPPGPGLALNPVRHEALRSLTFEAGCLPAAVSRGVVASTLPKLEHLELWLGDAWSSDCGDSGDTTVEDLAPVFAGTTFPALKSLGIRNSRITNEVAAALAESPLLPRLEALDLSLGTLSDAGALALLKSGALAHLKRLDIHHHYVSDEVLDGLKATGVDLNADDRQEPEDDDRDDDDEEGGEGRRFIAIGE